MPPSLERQPFDTGNVPRFNERRLLQAIRRMGEASKADLARLTNLTNTAVGTIVTSLHRQQLLQISGKRHEGQRGQPATLYRLNPSGAYGIGVRVDRTWIQSILIDFDGAVLSRLSHEIILPTPKKALEVILKDIRTLLEMLSDEQRQRLSGIGLAYPYNLDSWLTELALPNQDFRHWQHFDLAERIEEATSLPVFGENDTTAASIAELFYGVGRHIDDFLYIFMGPGIGGGIVIGGDSVRGPLGNAGDIGLTLVPQSTLPSAPQPKKAWDILLNRASINTLIRHLRYRGYEVNSFSNVEQYVDQHNPAVDEWLADCVAALTPVIWSGAALLDCPVVVVASDLAGSFILRLLALLEPALAECAPESRTPPRVVPGSLGSDAEAIGAANLPFFYNFSPQDRL
jgi:predicted NBD/HSP70 family sugar kinase